MRNMFWIAVAVLGLVALAAPFAFSAPRPESSSMATPTNIYGSGGVPFAQTDAGAMKTEASLTSKHTDAGVLKNAPEGFNPAVNDTACVLCSTVGDGGVLPQTAGTAYELSVIDSSGSPVRIANGRACVDFAATGVGQMLPANAVLHQTAVKAPDGGVATYYTCCAQTATATPSGPWLCASPLPQ